MYITSHSDGKGAFRERGDIYPSINQPNLEENPPKVFKDGCAPKGHTPKAVTTWNTSLKLDKEAKKKLTEDTEKMSKIQVEDLQSKLLSMGLPMKVVSAMKKSELGRVVAGGFAISASKS